MIAATTNFKKRTLTLLFTRSFFLAPLLCSFFFCSRVYSDTELNEREEIHLARDLIVTRNEEGIFVKRKGIVVQLAKYFQSQLDLHHGNFFTMASLSKGKEKLVLEGTFEEKGNPQVVDELTFTLDQLEARIENVIALRLHQKKQYEAAIEGFKKALKLDPQYTFATYNLASALTLSGKKEEASQTLLPLLKENVAKTYLAILKDPELRPLLEISAIAAFRSETAGTAKLKSRDSSSYWAAYSPKYHLLGVYDPELGMKVYSLDTKKPVAVLDVYLESCNGDNDGSGECERELKVAAAKDFRKKSPLANEFLSQLGFVDLAEKEQGVADQESDASDPESSSLTFLRFPKSHFRLSISKDGKSRLRKDQEILSAFNIMGHHERYRFGQGMYLPQVNCVVFVWYASGLMFTDYSQGTEIIVLTQGTNSPNIAPISPEGSSSSKNPSTIKDQDTAFQTLVIKYAKAHKSFIAAWWSCNLDESPDLERVAMVVPTTAAKEEFFDGEDRALLIVEKGTRNWGLSFQYDGRTAINGMMLTALFQENPNTVPKWDHQKNPFLVHRNGYHDGYEDTLIAIRNNDLVIVRKVEGGTRANSPKVTDYDRLAQKKRSTFKGYPTFFKIDPTRPSPTGKADDSTFFLIPLDLQ